MATLKQIARAAEVSIRTVARVLHGGGPVAGATRRRVDAALAELGYRPNRAARRLKAGRSDEIAVLVGTVDELHMAKIAALERALRGRGLGVVLTFWHPGQDAAESLPVTAAFDSALERDPAGLVLFRGRASLADGERARLRRFAGPCVFVDTPDRQADCVLIDRAHGIAEAVRHLHAAGRRRIAYLGYRSATRTEGYRRAMRAAGLPPRMLIAESVGAQYEDGLNATRRLLIHRDRPDALQVYSDTMAAGVLAGLHAAGVAVPGDIAVVGFDDRHLARLLWPPLTTVAQPNAAVGAAVAELLLSRLDGAAGAPRAPRIPTRLVVRSSA